MDWLLEQELIKYAAAIALCIVAYKLLGRLFGSKARLRGAAEDANLRHEIIFNSGFRWAMVDPATYPHLDHAYYAKATESMAKLGFEPVGDVEYLHVSEGNPATRTFVRVFTEKQGRCYAAAFHIRVRGLNKWLLRLLRAPSDMRVMEFNTSLSNGHFIFSTNTANLPGLTQPREFHKHRYDPSISPRALLERHLESVAQYSRGREENAQPRGATTLEAVLQEEERQYVVEQAYRNQTGAIDEEELARLAPHMKESERRDYLRELERTRK